MNDNYNFDQDEFAIFNNAQGELIILSNGLFVIDESKGFGGDLSQYLGVFIYAENVLLRGLLKAKQILISAYAFDSEKGVIDVSGTDGKTPTPDTAESEFDGTNGENSGNVYIHSDYFDADKEDIRILAIGGNGGDSRLKSTGTAGNGGAGGRVYLQIGFQNDSSLSNNIDEEDLCQQNLDLQYWLHERTQTQGGNGGRATVKRGSDGTHGKVKTKIFRDWLNIDTEKLLVHPDQCRMYLQKAKRYYWISDIHQEAKVYNLVYQMLLQLEKRLDYVLQENVLFNYLGQEVKLGTIIGEKKDNVFKIMRTETIALLNRLQQGYDFYNHEYNWVPNLSFSFYLRLAEQMQKFFHEAEQTYLSYKKNLKNEQVNMEQINQSKMRLDIISEQTENTKHDLENELNHLENLIAIHDAKVNARKNDMLEGLANLKEKVDNAFGYSLSDLISAISMCGFAPDSKLIIGSQVLDFFYKSKEMIINSQGISYQKSYIIDEIKRCSNGLEDIMEGYKSLKDGSKKLDDPGANKLLVQEEGLLKLLDQFYSSIKGYKEDRNKIESYVNEILLRNDLILNYNQTLLSWVSKNIEILSAKQQKELLQNDMLQHVKPNLPFLVNFMTEVYNQAKERLLEILYMTQRAYNYWALESKNIISSIMNSKSPGEMTSELFGQVISAMKYDYAMTMEGWKTGANIFPDKEDEPGFIITINGDELINYLIDLSTNGSFTYSLYSHKKDQQDKIDPFKRYYNVRVNIVRLKLIGEAIKNKRIAVKIIHGTNENIRNERGVYKTFIHSPVYLIYEHDYSSGQTFTDGKFETEDKKYESRSPLCQWEFFIENVDNSETKFPYFDIEEIQIEFHGTFQVRI